MKVRIDRTLESKVEEKQLVSVSSKRKEEEEEMSWPHCQDEVP